MCQRLTRARVSLATCHTEICKVHVTLGHGKGGKWVYYRARVSLAPCHTSTCIGAPRCPCTRRPLPARRPVCRVHLTL